MEKLISVSKRMWPEEILVEPSRLASGIWGEPEGDIAAAYCADTFPKIRTFKHEGQPYVNSGTAIKTSTDEEGVDGYPLISEDQYSGPEPRRYTYEGRTVEYKKRRYRLGPRIIFAARVRNVEEWTDLLRRQYAHGGYFASGKTYKHVLRDFRKRSSRMPRNELVAIERELKIEDQPRTQMEMLSRLKGDVRQDKCETQTELRFS